MNFDGTFDLTSAEIVTIFESRRAELDQFAYINAAVSRIL